MKTALVTGGAGFIGSHLCERLLSEGKKVIAVDNYITGNKKNIEHLKHNESFTLLEADVSEPVKSYLSSNLQIDELFHFASPASPRGYMDEPIATYKVNSFGTHYLLEYAKKSNAKFLYASTSEVYGDPLEHPQKEKYWGNVNPIGVRACYDVSKRFGEMAVTTFARKFNLDVRYVRIFNTYGPRMDPRDGRVIPNFVMQALRGEPLTVHGDGRQTRSFCYVTDLVEFIIRAMDSPQARNTPINIGTDKEFTMLDLALQIKKLTNTSSNIVYARAREDDPARRKPALAKAKQILKYEAKVTLDDGLKSTIDYFKKQI